MLFLVFAIVVSGLAWLFVKRTEDDPAARRAGIAWAIVCVGAALAIRAGLGLLVAAAALVALVVWVRRLGRGGGGPGDDGPDPPSDPDPDPGPGAVVRPEALDRDAFDRARAEWEHELPKRS